MTRFYSQDIHPSRIKPTTLKSLNILSIVKDTHFYTNTGILSTQKGGLCRIERINEGKCEMHKIGDFNILSDNSETRLVPVHSQLPNEYFVKRPVVARYKLTNSVLVVEKDGEYVTDFYIESNHPISKDVLQEDISSFLSKVN